VKARGYAVSDGENAYGLRTLAVPVLDAGGQPVAGVSLTVDAQRMPLERLVESARPRAQSVAEALSAALRHSGGAIATTPHR